MKKPLILVVDDEPDIRELVKDILQDEGFRVQLASSASEGARCVDREKPGLVLLDIWMPGEDGLSLLKKWEKEDKITFPVVVISGHGTVYTAVEATQLGAKAFIEKPLTTTKLLQTVREVLPKHAQEPVRPPAGSSSIAKEMLDLAQGASENTLPLWIAGGSGVGKVSLARYVDSLDKSGQDTVRIIDCKSDNGLGFVKTLPHNPVPVYTKTTAIFRQLPELNLTSQDVVAKSVRSCFWHRVVATGSDTPDRLVQSGKIIKKIAELFRDNVIFVESLRKRMADIPEIASRSIDFLCENEDLTYRCLSTAAINFLMHSPWLNNLKELEQVLRRLLRHGSSSSISLLEIQSSLISIPDRYDIQDVFSQPLKEAREMFERIYLEKRLHENDGSIARTAVAVGVERTHLYRKLKSLNIKH